MPDFLPRRDLDLLQWTGGFARGLLAVAEAVGVDRERADDYDALQKAFAERLSAAVTPITRTGPAITGKDALRADLVSETRALAAIVRAHPGVAPETLVELGLRPRNPRRTRLAAPDAPPRIGIVGVEGRTVRLRLRDADRPSSSARPRNTRAAQILVWVGDRPPADPARWSLYGYATRTTVRVDFERYAFGGVSPVELPFGVRVWICARWLGRRLQPGPLSDAVTTRLVADHATSLPSVMRCAA